MKMKTSYETRNKSFESIKTYGFTIDECALIQ